VNILFQTESEQNITLLVFVGKKQRSSIDMMSLHEQREFYRSVLSSAQKDNQGEPHDEQQLGGKWL
jgi:hypothetical protein